MGRKEKTVRHLAAIEGFMNWAEGFSQKGEWEFAGKAFLIGMHALLTTKYEKGWKKSPEYGELKARIREVYKGISQRDVLNFKWRHIMHLFFRWDSLARLLYSTRCNIVNLLAK